MRLITTRNMLISQINVTYFIIYLSMRFETTLYHYTLFFTVFSSSLKTYLKFRLIQKKLFKRPFKNQESH